MEHKLKRFNILLDDESLLYFPGTFLTGRVLLELEENTPVTGLYFHIIGEGVVSLEGSAARGRRGARDKRPREQQQQRRQDRENYIDFRMRILGDGRPTNADDADAVAVGEERHDESGGRRGASGGAPSSATSSTCSAWTAARADSRALVLTPGVHSFPFKLGLPASLPSTFLGVHGWVQYFCRAILEQPSGLVHKNQQVFIVINPIDLSDEAPALRQPFHCEAEEELGGGLCARAGLVSCRVRLDRGGFVPGESILVSATVENASRLPIKKVRASLAETVEYRARNRIVQTETRQLAQVERGKVAPHATQVWKKEPLQIPALPPTNLRGCHLIKISYEVLFQLETRAAGRKRCIKLQLPIVMATYPVRNTDGTLKRRKHARYPNSLPLLRPWMKAVAGAAV